MIFHRIDAEIPPQNEGHSWASWEHAQPDEPGTPPLLATLRQASTLVRGGSAPDGEVRRVFWRDLATALGLALTPRLTDRELAKGFGGSWPRHFFGPHEGRLDATQIVILAELLAGHRPTSDAFSANGGSPRMTGTVGMIRPFRAASWMWRPCTASRT